MSFVPLNLSVLARRAAVVLSLAVVGGPAFASLSMGSAIFTPGPPEHAAEHAMSTRAVAAMKFTFHEGARQGAFTASLSACMDLVPATRFEPLFRASYERVLTPAELATLEAYWASPAGVAVVRFGLLGDYQEADEDPPEPVLPPSDADEAQTQLHDQTDAAKKLAAAEAVERPVIDEAMSRLVREDFQRCRDAETKPAP